MYMVKADRVKGHKAGYWEARWYFVNRTDANAQVSKAWDAVDRDGAYMYSTVKLVRLKDKMKERI